MNDSFRARLQSGQKLLGTMLTLPSPAVAEILAGVGFDWLFVDGEHGPFEIGDVQAVLQAAARDVACIVRVPALEEVPIKKVLDVGAAMGYSSAVLAALAGTVVGLEVNEALVETGNAILNDMEIDNAALVAGDLAEGLSGQGPFDVIFLNGAVASPGEKLLAQLNDGGRLILVERSGLVGEAVIYQRNGDTFAQRVLFDAQAAALPGFEIEAGFAF